MQLINFASHKALSAAAAGMVIEEIRRNPSLLLCPASGNTPTLTYELLGAEGARVPGLFAGMRLVKLDEWGTIHALDPGSCEYYLREKLVIPFGIPSERVLSFDGNSSSPEAECQRIQKALAETGPIDVCILGLGLNGHIAFNEPAAYLTAECHRTSLSEASLRHPMTLAMKSVPQYGLTLGMAAILQAKKILLLISGLQKQEITAKLLSKQITTSLPASFLWLHPNVTFLICDTPLD